jgi:hypothetical protein
MGPERVLRIVAERAPGGFARIEDVMTRDELEGIARCYKTTAGFDVETLNTRPSWSVARSVQAPRPGGPVGGRPQVSGIVGSSNEKGRISTMRPWRNRHT